MHKQVSGCTVNFGPNFPESPFLELKTRKPPPPHFGKLQIWDHQRNSGITPPFGKLQIWDDQSFVLRNTPPRQFRNAESYYMWRLYPTGITTRCFCFLDLTELSVSRKENCFVNSLIRYEVHEFTFTLSPTASVNSVSALLLTLTIFVKTEFSEIYSYVYKMN